MNKTDFVFWEEPLAGYSWTNIVRVLWQNRFRMHIKYLPRLLYTIIMSTLFLPLRIKEYLLLHRRIKATVIEKDPVFIVGHYRTGTTYLLTLLSKDKTKGYVSNVEAYLPHVFLGSPKITDWIIGLSLPEQRPMDNVEMGIAEPTEEEYATGAMDKYGYYNGFIFPRNFRQYSKYCSFRECKPGEIDRWWRGFHYFLQKMTIKYQGKRMFLKNPTSTYRIPYLLKKYPNAKWIHIYRNPYEVFLSTVKFFREVFAIYTLQTWDDEDMLQYILRDNREMYELWEQDKHLIPSENLVEIRYEEFIQQPMEIMERIYGQLNLNGIDQTRPAFQAHVDAQREYVANKHNVDDEVIRKVNDYMVEYIRNFNYEMLTPQTAPEET